MDDESKIMLRELLDLQREQTELLRTRLLSPWMQLRFSVRSLLILMTLVGIVLGGIVFLKDLRSGPPRGVPVSPTIFVE
jgi:hypothetical protein